MSEDSMDKLFREAVIDELQDFPRDRGGFRFQLGVTFRFTATI